MFAKHDLMRFQDKTIVLTGASIGIGRVLAITLAQQQANLVLAARNATALAETVEACKRRGGQAIAVPTDVTDPEACKRLIEEAVQHFGAIDVLVNNAGIGAIARF